MGKIEVESRPVVPRKQPPQQPPPAQKMRLRYAKRGTARFTSHRDFGRALERALRRADVPMAYSSGFNPHPRISYANAAPTGASSEAEYVELGLAKTCDPGKLLAALNDSLPGGFVMLDAAEALAEPLGDLLQASDWVVSLEADPKTVSQAIEQLLGQESVVVERMTKNGLRSFDVRAAVLGCVKHPDGFQVRIRHTTPLVRPDDVVSALRGFAPELPKLVLLHRVTQGPLTVDGIGDPLRP